MNYTWAFFITRLTLIMGLYLCRIKIKKQNLFQKPRKREMNNFLGYVAGNIKQQ